MSLRALVILLLSLAASPLVADESIALGPIPTNRVDETPQSGIRWEKDLTKGRAQMVKSNHPMILFITAPSCLYCDQMKDNTLSQTWIIKEVNTKYTPVMVDGREHKSIADRLRVRMFPALAIVHPSGKVVEMTQGYKSAPELLKHLAIAQSKLKIENEKIASAQAKTKSVVK